MRSLMVALSTLALVLGLAPAATAQSNTVRPGNDDFEVTVGADPNASDLRPGGHVQFRVSVVNEHGSRFIPTNLNSYGLLVPEGFVHQASSGDIDDVAQTGTYIGGDNPGIFGLTGNQTFQGNSRTFTLRVGIPSDAQAGVNYPIGTRINIRGGVTSAQTHTVDPVINLVLPAVQSATQVNVAPAVARVGEPVTLTANVSAVYGTNVPEGTVSFNADGQSLSAPVVNGVATTTATFSSIGEKPVTATFTPANGNVWRTSSGTGAVNVQTEATQTNLTLDPVTVMAGDVVEATARLTPQSATGNVIFTVGDQSQSIPVRLGVATANLTITSSGEQTIVATFEPSNPARFTTSSDDASVIVSEVDTTTTVSVTPDSAPAGQRFELTARVQPTDATGTVTFVVDGLTLTAPVENGTATVYTNLYSAGSHTVTATFASDDPEQWVGSKGTATVAVDAVGTQTEISVDPATVDAGQDVTLTARVTPADVPGTVVFTVDGRQYEAEVVSGVATASVPFTEAGDREVTATFMPQDAGRYSESSDTAIVSVTSTGTETGTSGSLGSLTGSLGS